jgi:hypothetical protein
MAQSEITMQEISGFFDNTSVQNKLILENELNLDEDKF